MKKASVLAVIFAALALGAQARAQSRIEKHLALSPGGEFVLQADGGSVTVTRGNSSGAEVVITSNRGDLQSRYTFNFESSPGFARVTARRNGSFWNWGWGWHGSLHFDVTVPAETRLSLKTGGGSIVVSSLRGEEELNTSGGSIDASDIRGNLSANTSGGSINLREVDGDAVIATSGGSIRVASLDGSLQAHTSGGPIRITGVTGRVEASTSGGSVEAVFARGDSRGGDLETSGGSINVRLDPSVNLNIDASTSGGSVSSDLPLRVVGKISKSNLRGTLGSGGEMLRLHTSGGSIHIASNAT